MFPSGARYPSGLRYPGGDVLTVDMDIGDSTSFEVAIDVALAAAIVESSRPSLDLYVETTSAEQRTSRWDTSSNAADRFTGLSFSTAQMDGFKALGLTLQRDIDRDYPDLRLFDDLAVVSADGAAVWEGRIAAQPRSHDEQGPSITVDAVGHMAHARDQSFSHVFIDRGLDGWVNEPTVRRKAALFAMVPASYATSSGGSTTVSADPVGGEPALELSFTRIANTAASRNVIETWYDAGLGNEIGLVSWAGATTRNLTSPWSGSVYLSSDDILTQSDVAAVTAAGQVIATNPRRWAMANLLYNGDLIADGDWRMFLKNLAVIGPHGITLQGTPAGVTAADVIRWIVANYCPQLNTDGVQDTGFPIPHLVFRDTIDPYDAFLTVNTYHLWSLACWENKTVHYGPMDLDNATWQARVSDPGTTIDLQGDSTESFFNGIVVNYTTPHGVSERLTPDDTADLADENTENEATRHGLKRWARINVSVPVTRDAATQIGIAALAEHNTPRSPGSITVRGHIRDAAGNWQQGWKVRAGDTIALADHPNARPRLITDTQWNHDAKAVAITTDNAISSLDAVLARVGVGLDAANLT